MQCARARFHSDAPIRPCSTKRTARSFSYRSSFAVIRARVCSSTLIAGHTRVRCAWQTNLGTHHRTRPLLGTQHAAYRAGAGAFHGVLDGDLLSERALARPIDSTAACPFLSALIACKGLILFRVPQQPLRSFGPFPL